MSFALCPVIGWYPVKGIPSLVLCDCLVSHQGVPCFALCVFGCSCQKVSIAYNRLESRPGQPLLCDRLESCTGVPCFVMDWHPVLGVPYLMSWPHLDHALDLWKMDGWSFDAKLMRHFAHFASATEVGSRRCWLLSGGGAPVCILSSEVPHAPSQVAAPQSAGQCIIEVNMYFFAM